VMNAVDPRFVMPIFSGAFAAGADYLDMAMSLSARHPDQPYARLATLGVRFNGARWTPATT